RGRISSIIAPKDILRDESLLVISSIFFAAPWRYQFSPRKTSVEPFVIPGKKKKTMNVHMMYLFAPFVSRHRGAVKTLVMEYLKGEYSMILMVSDGDVASLAKKVNNPGALAKILAGCKRQRVKVFLPRFSISGEYDISWPVEQLGFGWLFSPNGDLSGISAGRTYVSKVKHSAMIKVDEKGTVPAAVTAIFALKNGNPAYPKIHFNKPFVYIVRDNRTGAILFMGQVVRPTPAAGKPAPRMRH
ncbi:serpin family protein, partial [Myxococcota bacterium]|nr:serpin family protein [Myxococcota bacterium]